MALALHCTDADATRSAWQEAGLASDLCDLGRVLEPETELRFTNVKLAPEATGGVPLFAASDRRRSRCASPSGSSIPTARSGSPRSPSRSRSRAPWSSRCRRCSAAPASPRPTTRWPCTPGTAWCCSRRRTTSTCCIRISRDPGAGHAPDARHAQPGGARPRADRGVARGARRALQPRSQGRDRRRAQADARRDARVRRWRVFLYLR